MTTCGAEQYLNTLAKGLYQTVRSLIAEENQEVKQQDIPPLVAQLINRTLRHRMPAIEGMRAVCL